MKWRKVMDGVYEGKAFKPEKLRAVPKNYAMNDRLRDIIDAIPARITSVFHFWQRDSSADNWHLDGPTDPAHDHMLILIACGDRKVGTEVKDGRKVRQCKTWTPYIIRSDVEHRAPRHQSEKPRHFYRFYLQLDERRLDNNTNRD